MRRLIVDLLDFLCLATIVVASLVGFWLGGGGPNIQFLGFSFFGAVLGGAAAFVASSVVMGAILVLTEIAKNTRRMILLLEAK